MTGLSPAKSLTVLTSGERPCSTCNGSHGDPPRTHRCSTCSDLDGRAWTSMFPPRLIMMRRNALPIVALARKLGPKTIHVETRADGAVDDDEGAGRVGGPGMAVHVERRVAGGLHDGQDHPEVVGPAAGHHRVGRDLLQRPAPVVGRNQRDQLVPRAQRSREHALHALARAGVIERSVSSACAMHQSSSLRGGVPRGALRSADRADCHRLESSPPSCSGGSRQGPEAAALRGAWNANPAADTGHGRGHRHRGRFGGPEPSRSLWSLSASPERRSR